MRYVLFAVAILLITSSFSTSTNLCLKPQEQKLYDLLMKYREEKGLPPIPLSYSLTLVAKTHTYDLYVNNPVNSRCNLHSWSDKGKNKWTACCYTSDHKKAECMWNKPRELSKYKGHGFEISAMVTQKDVAQAAINGWKNSYGHNEVMINEGSWKNTEWQAVGIGITGNYAVIWFGTLKDPDMQTLQLCP